MTTRNKRIWHDPLPCSPSAALINEVGGHLLTAQILAQRGFEDPMAARAFLSPHDYPPTPPEALPDLVCASDLLWSALQSQKTILVWGDFDVDGQTATALLVSALRALGAIVEYYLPHRLRESHGIRVPSLQQQLDTLQAPVLLTCDTGVSAHEAVDYAKSRGAVTIITDHHDLPSTLPAADAVVNPKRLPAEHPLATLPGVGVAYKLVEHLFTRSGRPNDLPGLLDLVALGIVADVADQRRDTRYLLQLGMEQLRSTQRVGLRALFDVAGVQAATLTDSDIAFQLAPRLNAAGRLADATPAVRLLSTTDATEARLLAAQLEGLNSQRKLQNRQILAAAQEQIAQDPSLLDWEALVLSHTAWHPGIIGIVAGQLAEQYYRPVVLFCENEDGTARGSARSVPGYDIGMAVAAQADLLTEYGGHPGAAGLSLPIEHILAFRRRLSNTLHETHDPSARPGLQLDAYISLDNLSLELVTQLNQLAPFGEGNPRITLATRDLHLVSVSHIGSAREHRRLIVEDSNGTRRTVLWWRSADQPLPSDDLFDLAYEIDINTFRDEPELQLTLVDYRRSASAPIHITRPQRQVLDYRRATSPTQTLDDILADHPGAVVWAEGYRQAESPGIPLTDLTVSPVLVVYTAPGSPQTLQEALEKAQPDTVALVGIDPPIQGIEAVLTRLLQLIKYVINHQQGRSTLDAFAGAVGQTNATIRLALDYLAARGEITVDYKRGGDILVGSGKRIPNDNAPALLTTLNTSLNETNAYRAFFRRARPHQVLGWDEEEVRLL